jgi:hypothetical protein
MVQRSAHLRSDLISVESTQTVRAISPAELKDPSQRKWFVVQLVTSEQPINLDLMPRLEVFASHRLYVVEARHGATSLYGLRLGFFDDEVAVSAICGYLKTFFGSPSVLRVSGAEQARFAESSTNGERLPRPWAVTEVSTQQPASREAPQPSFVLIKPAVAPIKPRKTSTTAQKSTATSNARGPKTASSSQLRGSRPKTLGEELLEEARQLQLSKSSKRTAVERPRSWLSRLLGGSKA